MQKITDNIAVLISVGIAGSFLFSISFILIQVRQQRRMFLQKKKADEAEIMHQAALLQTVIISQDEERKRVGQDLHDDVGTALSNLRMTIEAIPKLEEIEGIQDRCKQMIDAVIQNVRAISHDLAPPCLEYLGFFEALEELAETVTTIHRIQININTGASMPAAELSRTQKVSLYRVMEELMNNTIKHADADSITITIEQEQQALLITYNDDGKGLGEQAILKKGMGLLNIESRLLVIGAELKIAAPENGFLALIKLNLIRSV